MKVSVVILPPKILLDGLLEGKAPTMTGTTLSLSYFLLFAGQFSGSVSAIWLK